MSKNKVKFLFLVLLAFIFSCPGIAAWLFYKNPQWLNAKSINHGRLMNPPEKLAFLENTAKWRLIFWSPTACDSVCYKAIDKLARLRLSLGRQLYSVETWLLLDEKAAILPDALKIYLQESDIRFSYIPDHRYTTQSSFGSVAQIFIASPDNYLVLAYEKETKPKAIFDDLHVLLKTTQQKSM